MQPADAKHRKDSLILALKHYGSAVSNMERTVLLPSLLRDVPSDESPADLYTSYTMLKAIRNMVESSLAGSDEHRCKNLGRTTEPLLDADPEALLLFHLRGLFSVMSELTKKTHSLTEKYLDIIGAAN